MRRKLDGITYQIDENLAQPRRVAYQTVWDPGKDIASQLQAFPVRGQRQQTQQVIQSIVEIEVDGFHVELSRLNLAKIKNIVEQGEQGIRGTLDHAQIFALLRR